MKMMGQNGKQKYSTIHTPELREYFIFCSVCHIRGVTWMTAKRFAEASLRAMDWRKLKGQWVCAECFEDSKGG